MGFLQLPREIRDQVYGYVVDMLIDVREDEHGYVDIPLPQGNTPELPYLRYNIPAQSSFLGFMLSCKTVYQELQDLQQRRYRRPKIDYNRPRWSVKDGRMHGLLNIERGRGQECQWRATFSWIGLPLRPRQPTMAALTVLFANFSNSSGEFHAGSFYLSIIVSLLRLLQRHGTTLGAVGKDVVMPRAGVGWVFIQLTMERFESCRWFKNLSSDFYSIQVNDFIAALSSGPDALLADSVGRTDWNDMVPHLSWLDRWFRERYGFQLVVQDAFHLKLKPEQQDQPKGKRRLE